VCYVFDIMKWCTVCIDSEEWLLTVNETQLNWINVTELHPTTEYVMLVVALNDVGKTASDKIHVLVGTPYAQFGIFAQFSLGDRI